jgi:hypothetical protein
MQRLDEWLTIKITKRCLTDQLSIVCSTTCKHCRHSFVANGLLQKNMQDGSKQ